MYRRADVGGIEACQGERRLPDRHVALVHDDDQRVRQGPDEGQSHARVRAVRPEAHEEHRERGREERQSKNLDDRDVRAEQELRREPQDDRRGDQWDEAEADLGEVGQPATDEQAKDQAEGDPGDQHAEPSLSAGGACTSVIIAARRRLCRSALRPSGPDAARRAAARIDGRGTQTCLAAAVVGAVGEAGLPVAPGSSCKVAVLFIRSAACAISGICRGSGRRPGSGTPST